jgi:HEAT repeat protein
MTATVLLLLAPLSAAPPEPAVPAAETAVSERQMAGWIADLSSKEYEAQRIAYVGLCKAKPKAAVPALIKLLGEKNGPVYYAAGILGAIGPDAKEAVPALLALVPKDGTANYGIESIALALAKIDGAKLEATRAQLLGTQRCRPNLLVGSEVLREYPAQVIPHVVALCEDKEPHVRARAAEFLGTLKEKEIQKVPPKSLFELAGDGAKGVAPALEKLLADENREVKLAAARAISRVAPELTEKSLPVVVALGKQSLKGKATVHATDIFNPVPQQALKVLLPLFDDPSDSVRWWAITHVGPLPIREPIEDVLKNAKTARARSAAAEALGHRYGGATQSIPALKAALGDTEFAVRFAAALALVQIGDGTGHADAIPALVEGLQQTSEDVRIKASRNLLQTKSAAKGAIPALAKLLDDKVPEVRFEAALALVGIDPSKAAGGVPALIAGVESDNDNSVLRATKALAVLGPVAKDAAPALLAKCDTQYPQWRQHAAAALARVDPAQTPKAVEVLVGLLKDRKAGIAHRDAITALRRIGPNAKSAMPALVELLNDKDYDHADVAVAMLVIDADGAKPALEWVRKVLTDKSSNDLYELTELLPQLGAAAKPLIPELVALLQSKVLFQRERAIEALGEIGPDAKDALPELKKISESDMRERIRNAIAEAVKKIEAK